MTTTTHNDSTRRVLASGLTAFAGVMLSTVALFQIFEGIAAIAKDDIYVSGVNYVYDLDITAWGWIHLVIGIIALATGIGILLGQTWGRLTGIALAIVSALASFAFLPYYPMWAVVVIGFNALVIWALCVQVGDRF